MSRPFLLLSLLAVRALAQPTPDAGQTQAVVAPTVLRAAEPRYPKEALATHAKATVVLELDLDQAGQVEEARVLREDAPSGLGFAAAAVQAAKDSAFSPALVDGAPTPSTIEFTVAFAPPAMGSVRGVVRSPVGAGVPGARVQVWASIDGHTVGRRGTTGAGGTFAFGELPPGRWTVEAAAEGYVRAHLEASVVADGVVSVTLTLGEPKADTEPSYDVLVERDETQGLARTFEDPSAVMRVTSAVATRAPIVGRAPSGFAGRGPGRGGTPPAGRPPGGAPPGGGPPGGGPPGGGPPSGGPPSGGPPGGAPPGGAAAPSASSATANASEGIPTGTANAALTPVTASGGFALRGNDPVLSRFFLDGVEVPALFHFGQLFSTTLTSALLSGVELYTGNFPAEYGRASIGLLAGGTELRPAKAFHFEVDANPAVQSAALRVPVGDTVTLFAGGTFSTLDRLLAAVVPASEAVSLSALPRFWDVAGGVTWRPSSKLASEALVLFSSDKAMNWPGTNPYQTASTRAVQSERWFGRALARVEWAPTDTVKVSVNLGGGPEHFTGTTYDVEVLHFGARAKVDWHLLPRLTLTGGVDATQQRDSGTVTSAGATVSLARNKLTSVAEHLTLTWTPLDRLELVAGARLDSTLTVNTTIDPRLSARFELLRGLPGAQSLALKAAAGWYHAPPPVLDLDPTIGNPSLLATRAAHFSAGADWRPLTSTLLSVQGFYVTLFTGIVTTSATTTREGATVPENLTNAAGHSLGLEVFVQQQLAHGLEGWLAYTLAQSVLSTSSSASPLSEWDQTHVLAVAASYQLPAGFKVSARFQYSTGTPTTATLGSVFDAANNQYLPYYGATFGSRASPFVQLDLKVEKAFRVGPCELGVSLDVRNVTNAKNVTGTLQYSFDFTQAGATTAIPLLPLLGVHLSY